MNEEKKIAQAIKAHRFNCSLLPMQNIPIRTELGSKIRSAFIPVKKCSHILNADYSQIEQRIIANLHNK